MRILRQVVHSRAFEIATQVAIIASILGFMVGTLPNLPDTWGTVVIAVEVASSMIFVTEYVVRTIENPKGYPLSFFGIVDLIAIAPIVLSLGLDLRSVRIVRLLRLAVLFRLRRLTFAFETIKQSFLTIRDELVLSLLATTIILLASASLIYVFEHEAQPEAFASVFHSIWWAVITFTTVGYGDVYPVTFMGRAFTCVLVLAGLGLVAVPTGLFASAVIQARKEKTVD